VVYFQDLSLATSDVLGAIRPFTKLIVGQIASPVPPEADLAGLDLIFSSFPHFVERFRNQGLTAYYQPLAFDPRVLKSLPSLTRHYPVTFVGGLSAVHGKGTAFLERLADLIPMDFWGYGVQTLGPTSPIRLRHRDEAWGIDMFSRLSESFITVNRHIDVAENYANNMRLFEATGCGALLVTDYKDNLNELFEIGKEVVVYRSPEECAALIKYYLTHPDEAREIARAGQARTLHEHTYVARMEQTAEILSRHLRHRSEEGALPVPDLSMVSYGHTRIRPEAVDGKLTAAWQSSVIPVKQRALVQQELERMYQGRVPDLFQVLANCLKPYLFNGCTVLETGCASGYYYEVLEYLSSKRIRYTGVDYSEPLIAMAKAHYQSVRFEVADGSRLPFKDREFDIVVSGGVLLHVPLEAESSSIVIAQKG
jgi:2-polyprenyl-3-methyl-5-hydroxy-6-metoxy-1,4-benzoquinol methylase